MTPDLKELQRRISETVLAEGVFFGHVDERLAHVPYTYTVGRSMLGRPELVLSHDGNRAFREERLREAMDHDDVVVPFTAGDVATGCWLFGEAFPVQVDPWYGQLFFAVGTFGPHITALQLLWPDGEGAFPGDPRGFRGRQQVLVP